MIHKGEGSKYVQTKVKQKQTVKKTIWWGKQEKLPWRRGGKGEKGRGENGGTIPVLSYILTDPKGERKKKMKGIIVFNFKGGGIVMVGNRFF